jgi:hypothetical protein
MSDHWDEELSPRPDRHAAAGFPYPLDSTGDVHPGNGQGSEYALSHGMDPYPIDSSGDVHPQAQRHDGDMPLNLGKTKGHL